MPLLLRLLPAILAAAMGFGAAWTLQGRNLDALKLEQANERISQQQAARATIERTTTAVIKAQNDATARAVVLRRDADAARSAASGLRDTLETTVRASATGIDACTVTARTASELLAECADRYTDMAGKAQGHLSDVRTLVDAWPK